MIIAVRAFRDAGHASLRCKSGSRRLLSTYKVRRFRVPLRIIRFCFEWRGGDNWAIDADASITDCHQQRRARFTTSTLTSPQGSFEYQIVRRFCNVGVTLGNAAYQGTEGICGSFSSQSPPASIQQVAGSAFRSKCRQRSTRCVVFFNRLGSARAPSALHRGFRLNCC